MRISDLEKRFDGFSLRVDDLNLSPGGIYGLIGPNGCGKTTLMKLLAGLLSPDGGEIDYDGLTAQDITMAPRRPYFLRDSVYRNLIYPLELRGIKPDAELVDHYLELAGLKDRRKQYAPSLSTGEQQKLSIIRALIFSPKLILVDEAFSNLDIESVGAFERLILERQREKAVTWVVISHQIAHIQRLCGHVFFMHNGRIEAEGPADGMLLRPKNTLLQRYLQYETLKEGLGMPDGIFEG